LYPFVLNIHSWLRWLTLLLAIGATLNAFRADRDLSQRPPGRQWDTLFMMALDFQVLFGIVLYFVLSPLTKAAMNNPGGIISNPTLRFWALSHLAAMVAATLLVRIGRVLALTAKTPGARRQRRLTFFVLTTMAILIGIPWPWMSIGRPLFRF
jgi:hypothetical protein